jgi:hypothetical protein
MVLLPKIAQQNPNAFKDDYLNLTINYLVNEIKTKKEISEKRQPFLSLGEIASVP